MEHERGKCEGYWEWFRKDGTKMRSDYFKKGKQTGKWNTFDAREIFYGFLGTENLLDFLVLKKRSHLERCGFLSGFLT